MKLSNLDLDLRLSAPPMVLVSIIVIGSFIPMGIASAIWFKRNYFDPNPRIHIFQDMDNQARGNTQSASNVFADGLTMRKYVPGTVAYGRSTTAGPDPSMLKDDDLAYRGFEISPETGETVTVDGGDAGPQPKYLPGYPETVTVDAAFVKRGQEQYKIHCYTCHGIDGRGMGPTKLAMDVWAKFDVNAATEKKSGTVALIPANIGAEPSGKFNEGVYTNGKMFNVITKGQGTMNALGPQIKVKDRWAIIAYVRAMQKSQAATLTDAAE